MTTVVNTPAGQSDNSSAMGLIVGLILVLGVILLLAMFARGGFNFGNGGTDVNVPGQIDVNVDTPQGGQ